MAVFTHLETDTGTNADISSATAIGAYTAAADKLVMVDVSIDAVAGNGDYVMYVTRQIGGSGSAYRILPKTTLTAASGLTAISAQSGWITVRNGDVLTCYVDGLAGDTSTPDWTTRWYELAGVTAAAVADAVWDEAIADHVGAGSFGAKNQKAVPSETLNDYKADVSSLALEATLTAIKGEGWSTETLAAIDVLIDAIKAKTDLIPAAPAPASEYDVRMAAMQADLDNPDQYKADVSGLAPANEYDAELTAIQADLDNPAQYKADVNGLALEATVAALNDISVSDILDGVIEGAYTLQDVLKIMAGVLAGKVSGGGSAQIVFRDLSDTLDRLTAVVDESGNRTTVTPNVN